MLGIQFAKLSGYRVIATCSPHNADYLKSLGADTTIDYREYSTPTNSHPRSIPSSTATT
jgi:NADPH:quinone reductase-like Zn-dependent oxidoreductase